MGIKELGKLGKQEDEEAPTARISRSLNVVVRSPTPLGWAKIAVGLNEVQILQALLCWQYGDGVGVLIL